MRLFFFVPGSYAIIPGKNDTEREKHNSFPLLKNHYIFARIVDFNPGVGYSKTE
jgi:hypothetical protein